MSQPGPDATQWDLTRLSVVGQLVTVQFLVKPAVGGYINIMGQRMGEVSLVDDTTSQRYTVLKDDASKYMAAPLANDGNTLRLSSSTKDAPVVVWFKFPAPPPESKTVSITIPGVGPFDGVVVNR